MLTLNDNDCTQLTIACSIIGGLFGIELLLAMHNVYRYLFKLKITKPLIVMFYVFVAMNNIGNMVEFFLKASDPRRFWTDGDEDMALKIAE